MNTFTLMILSALNANPLAAISDNTGCITVIGACLSKNVIQANVLAQNNKNVGTTGKGNAGILHKRNDGLLKIVDNDAMITGIGAGLSKNIIQANVLAQGNKNIATTGKGNAGILHKRNDGLLKIVDNDAMITGIGAGLSKNVIQANVLAQNNKNVGTTGKGNAGILHKRNDGLLKIVDNDAMITGIGAGLSKNIIQANVLAQNNKNVGTTGKGNAGILHKRNDGLLKIVDNDAMITGIGAGLSKNIIQANVLAQGNKNIATTGKGNAGILHKRNDGLLKVVDNDAMITGIGAGLSKNIIQANVLAQGNKNVATTGKGNAGTN